ncbi:MAG: integrase core domain-containing protein [Pseudomonadales bacterium]
MPEFERLFRSFGLPHAIRTDNGVPFSAVRFGFSRLSLWWMRLGIVHERIERGHPEQNGRHERMHRTLKVETTRPPGRDLRDQQQRFDRGRKEFNEERPHEALAQTPPGQHYTPSIRPYPERLPEVSCPPDHEVRRVRQAGEILWRSRRLYVTQLLVGELIGLQQLDEDRWQIWYAQRKVAILDERLKRVLPMSPV